MDITIPPDASDEVTIEIVRTVRWTGVAHEAGCATMVIALCCLGGWVAYLLLTVTS